MLLRSITEHVKAQNWFAVAIDFFIVVVGVFVGIQVANWNEGRAFRAQEALYLSQLRDEITENYQVVEHQIRYVERVVEGGKRGLAFLDSGVECIANCEALLVDFFHASQIWGSSYSDEIYKEVERLGLPTDEIARTVVSDYYQFIDGWDAVNATVPDFRDRLRGYISPEAAEVLWRGCYEIRMGQFEALSDDCVEDLKSMDLKPMLDNIQADARIAGELRFWIGQNIFAIQFYPDMREQAAHAVSTINDTLDSK